MMLMLISKECSDYKNHYPPKFCSLIFLKKPPRGAFKHFTLYQGKVNPQKNAHKSVFLITFCCWLQAVQALRAIRLERVVTR